jgi:hypothetical protein
MMATSKTSRERSDQLLFPERKKCRGCRGAFTFIVIDRQYCSYDCAGVAAPDVKEHPRSCWTDRDDPKYCYYTPDDADRAARQHNLAREPRERLHAYYCDRHHMWHIGNPQDVTGTGSSVDNWAMRLLREEVSR